MRLSLIASTSIVWGSVFLSSPSYADQYSSIVVFGDSLSDTGNLAAITSLPSPPFYNGRFSNGPLAVETLAQLLGLDLQPSLHLVSAPVGNNFAVAGARAAGLSPLDLPVQIAAFLAMHNGQAPADALYVLGIGGNDLRAARDAASEEEANIIIEQAVRSIASALRKLNRAGAQKFLVFNVPNIGIVPETEDSDQRQARDYSKTFNSELGQKLQNFEQRTGVDLVLFNSFAFMRLYLKDYQNYGLTNKTDPCFVGSEGTFHPDCLSAAGPLWDRFFWFDEVHPTAGFHRRFGRALFAVMPSPR